MSLSSCFTSLLADLQLVAGIHFKESYLSLPLSMAKTPQCNTATFKIHFVSLFAQSEIYTCHQPENPPVDTADLPDKPCQNSLGSWDVTATALCLDSWPKALTLHAKNHIRKSPEDRL